MDKEILDKIARIVGTAWLLMGAYGIVCGLLIPRDRLITLMISIPAAAVGLWLVVVGHPFGSSRNRE